MSALLKAALSLWLATPGLPHDSYDAQAAFQHRDKYKHEFWSDFLFISYASVEGEDRARLRAATRYVLACTSRQPIVERCTPIALTDTLSYVRLEDIQWERNFVDKLLKEYPYLNEYREFKSKLPILVRADWLILQLSDASENPAYYELLLGEVPETRDRWLEILGVNNKPDPLKTFGVIEDDSGVAVNATRVMQAFPSDAGDVWGTKDSLRITPDTDPLENLRFEDAAQLPHDGEEWLAPLEKIHLGSGVDGHVFACLLAAGNGNRVDKAPTNLVEDHTRFRDHPEVVTPGSCYQCHDNGWNLPTTNALKQFLASGAQIGYRVVDGHPELDREDRTVLEAFWMRKIERSLNRDNDYFQDIVPYIAGPHHSEPRNYTAEETAAVFGQCILDYEKPLDLTQVAHELGLLPAELQVALTRHTAAGGPLRLRAAQLVRGGTVRRATFEDEYENYYALKQDWEIWKLTNDRRFAPRGLPWSPPSRPYRPRDRGRIAE